MSSVTIYGASDDLIEVEGDLSEEFSPDSDDQETWLVFGDGTVLAVRYDDFGVWRITRPQVGTADFEKDEDPGNDENRYSDRVTLTGDLRWVIAAEKMTFHPIKAKVDA